MKQILTVLAHVNEHANRDLYRILAEAPRELRDRSNGGYFESAMGTLNHVLVSELAWLNRLRDAAVPAAVLKSPALEFQNPGFGKPLTTDFDVLRERREQVDSVFRSLVDELHQPALEAEVEQRDRQGNVRRQAVGFVLLHLMNHATHHRGQISQFLDENGIQHDYSGILQAMRQWED